MWSREALKFNAKQELKISYWLSLGVTVVASILGATSGGGGGGGGGNPFTLVSNLSNLGDYRYYGYGSSYLWSIMGAMLIGLIVASLVGIAIGAFLGNVVQVGKCAFFTRAPYGDRQFGNLFFGFRNGKYWGVVKAQFHTNLIIYLWSLLFVIPGVVKGYQYRMVPYLLAENPDLTGREAMDLSCAMTDGHKMEMFVLDLSFIGWYMLGVLACGIGVVFVNPYYEATMAQLYFALRPSVQVPPPQGFYGGPMGTVPPQQAWNGQQAQAYPGQNPADPNQAYQQPPVQNPYPGQGYADPGAGQPYAAPQQPADPWQQQTYAPGQPAQQPYQPAQPAQQPYQPAQQPYQPAQPGQQPYQPAQPYQPGQPYAPPPEPQPPVGSPYNPNPSADSSPENNGGN